MVMQLPVVGLTADHEVSRKMPSWSRWIYSRATHCFHRIHGVCWHQPMSFVRITRRVPAGVVRTSRSSRGVHRGIGLRARIWSAWEHPLVNLHTPLARDEIRRPDPGGGQLRSDADSLDNLVADPLTISRYHDFTSPLLLSGPVRRRNSFGRYFLLLPRRG